MSQFGTKTLYHQSRVNSEQTQILTNHGVTKIGQVDLEPLPEQSRLA